MRLLATVLVLMGIGGGAGMWYWQTTLQPHREYRVAKISRGDILSAIDSTGTLEPQQVIDVGAQVVGQIEAFGKDANGKVVDYRSPVEANMVLAQIDDAVYKADLNTARAQLDQANSSMQKGLADVKQAQAKEKQAAGNWTRAQTLIKTDALSQSDFEMYEANYDSALADVSVAQAEITQAQATIAAAKASLDKAQRNLDFCVIRSPVNGVIIDRRVNIGQTVVSSLDAPSLFLIAKDLSKMQLWVAVNEADIDHVKPGQKVTFTCEALDGESFNGVVNKVRLNAAITQNVVTYTVEVDADNPGGKLLPYMTANVEFEVNRDHDVMLVPNAALRWYPGSALDVVADARSQWKPVEEEDAHASETSQPTPVKIKKPKDRHGILWTREGEFVRPVDVQLGPTDNFNTEISTASLKEGTEVVIGDQIENAGSSDEHDPFVPKMPGHR